MISCVVSSAPCARARRTPAAARPTWRRDADDGGLLDLRVGHQLVLQLDRRDPLAARLDEVLGAVDEAHPAPLVDRRHVAGAQPAVVGEALAGPRVVVVRRRDPVAAALQLAARRRRPTARASCCRARRPALDAEGRRARPPARSSACSSLRQQQLVAVEPADRRDRARLGHPPRLQDRQAELLAVAPPTAPSARPSHRTGWPAGCDVSRPFSARQHLHPDRRHAGGDGDPLVDDEVGDRRPGQVRPGHHEVGTGRDAGVGETPRVGVEHRHDRQDRGRTR